MCVSAAGSVSRPGPGPGLGPGPGPVPAFLRSPPLIPAQLDVKPFLQFPLESPHPATIGLFHNFNAVSVRGRVHAPAHSLQPAAIPLYRQTAGLLFSVNYRDHGR